MRSLIAILTCSLSFLGFDNNILDISEWADGALVDEVKIVTGVLGDFLCDDDVKESDKLIIELGLSGFDGDRFSEELAGNDVDADVLDGVVNVISCENDLGGLGITVTDLAFAENSVLTISESVDSVLNVLGPLVLEVIFVKSKNEFTVEFSLVVLAGARFASIVEVSILGDFVPVTVKVFLANPGLFIEVFHSNDGVISAGATTSDGFNTSPKAQSGNKRTHLDN